MIFETPRQSKEVLSYLNSGNYRDEPILKNYPGFEVCFLAFHPFLRVKNGHENKILFETGKWPNKKQIVDHCERLGWSEFLRISGISDFKKLDQALAFFHRAYRFASKLEYLKLRNIILNVTEIIPPQVDNIPEILEDDILKFLNELGYSEILIYTDIDEKRSVLKIEDQLQNEKGLTYHVRIETPDSKVLIVQDFDQRATYLFSTATFVKKAIESISLEGFYCDDQTSESWSFEIPQENDLIDWATDMKT